MQLILTIITVNVGAILLYFLIDKIIEKTVSANAKKYMAYNVIALILAIFAVAFCSFWVYFVVLFTALPSAIISFLLTKKSVSLKTKTIFSKINYSLISLAIIWSIVMLVLGITR